MTLRRGIPTLFLAWTALAAGPAALGQQRVAPSPPEPATAQERAAQPEPAAMPNTWYARALASSEVGIHVTHFWSKGPKLRSEMVILGRPVVTIVNGDTYYAYESLGRAGIAIGRAPIAVQQDAGRQRPFGNELEALLRQGAERVGLEELADREVELFRITDALGRRQVWVTTDELRLPLRVEVYRRHTGKTVHTDFLDWQRGLPISDEFFQPDPSIRFLRFSFDEYVAAQADRKPLGPVPVLYTDLLHGY